MKKIIVINASVLLGAFLLVFLGYQVIQNVSTVHQIFFPKAIATLNIERDLNEWNKLEFDGEDYFVFNNFFWKKQITNDANSDCKVFMRIKDKRSNEIVDELEIPIGTSLFLDDLVKGTQYIFEVKSSQGDVFVNIS